MDIIPYIKALSKDEAFAKVADLYCTSIEISKDIVEYFDYVWSEFGNGDRWEHAVKWYGDSKGKIDNLTTRLHALMLILHESEELDEEFDEELDIAPLIMEMPRDEADNLIKEMKSIVDALMALPPNCYEGNLGERIASLSKDLEEMPSRLKERYDAMDKEYEAIEEAKRREFEGGKASQHAVIDYSSAEALVEKESGQS